MIVYQSRIYRADLQANPNVLYVFGDNYLRKGLGGQAAEMRGEPNAVGVATKWAPAMLDQHFFDDKDFNVIKEIIDNDVSILRAHNNHFDEWGREKIIVVPLDGIGTGLSELPTRAPKIYDYIVSLGLGAQNV